jgi:hypothetical protein
MKILLTQNCKILSHKIGQEKYKKNIISVLMKLVVAFADKTAI